MIVNSGNTEFGYELIATLPYAFHQWLNGNLDGTSSAIGSEPLYYFSPNHQVDPSPRDFAHTAAVAKRIPNMWIHKPMLDLQQWSPPNLAQHYGPQAIRFDKPTVVIYNRYNHEWGEPPINYFDLPTLRRLFGMLIGEYQVVYFNVRGQEVLEDNAHSMDLGDYELIAREFPEVMVIHDLVERHGGNYNEVQLRVFAGCKKFITMNGGPSILASYFGGENLIYSRRCRELSSKINSFYNWYHLFGGSDITVTNTLEDLSHKVRARWVEKAPKVNILVRCHDRPKSLKRAFQSILEQGYPNTRVIASYDNKATWEYLREYPFMKMAVTVPKEQPTKPPGDDYKGWLPSNVYINQMYEYVQHGMVMFLDDDDILEKDALWAVAAMAQEDRPVFFRAMCLERIVPSDEAFGKAPQPGEISGLGITFPAKYISAAQWEPWRRGDYRVAKQLAAISKPIWADRVIASTGSKSQKDEIKAARPIEERVAEINTKVKEVMEARGKTKQGVKKPPVRRLIGRPTVTSRRSRPSSGRG